MAPNPRPQTVYRKEIPDREAHSFDVSAFDEAIDSQGVRLIHYRSMRCPVGLIDIGDNRRPHEDHAGCSNGFVYTMAGAVTSLFTSNSKKEMSGDIGALEGATVSVTFQRFYDELDANGAPVPISISPYDRLYLDEPGIVVPTSGTFEYNMSGVNKLHFPVVAVHDLIDCNNIRYTEGEDFIIEKSRIVWKARSPGFDPVINKGRIFGCRYSYRPYWYVRNMMHEIRVTQAEDPITGIRDIHRMPQSAVLQREWLFENQENDPQAPEETKERQVQAPRKLSFGAR